MVKFNKLEVPYQWKDEFTKYPHGYSIFEALSKWVYQVNRMVTNINQWNEYLEGFTSNFGEVPQQVAELRQEMADLVDSINSDLTTITDEFTGLSDTLLSHLNDYATEMPLKADKLQEAWITPTLLNGWVESFPEHYQPVSYFKDTLGFVHIRGIITDGTDRHVFNLPTGYRPSGRILHMCFTTDSKPIFTIVDGTTGRFMINSSGDVGKTIVLRVTFRAV